MDKLSLPGTREDAYEKLSIHDPELDSDQGTITPMMDTTSWSLCRHKRDNLISCLWLCARVLFIATAVIACFASVWLIHLTSFELHQAQSILEDVRSSSSSTDYSTECSPESHSHYHETGGLSKSTLVPGFIPGGTLPVPGYGLVYNTTYCNGWADPEGAKLRGCVLDPSQGGWIHELCHDPALLAEWLKMPDFGWYHERKHRIPQERLWAGDIPGGPLTELYTSQNFHIQHCKFVMRLRIKNGMRKNRGLGYIALDPGHMNHCVELLTAPKTDPKELTKVIFGRFGGGTSGFGLASECYMPLL
ncbi:hypothetical protein BKA65DRAFT_513072 [Rhexocercosporidium sp. MPI-PUGE-AT-0058]|nr:hypothetical protein BKA65DRAFT_513072 [Rhexocercosporidium sp. MPI-PUGE-AT-0058]